MNWLWQIKVKVRWQPCVMCVEIRTWQPDTWENTCSSVPHMHWRSYCGVFGLLWPWSWGATHPQMLSGPPRTPHYKKTMFVVYLLHQQNILCSWYLLRKSPISPMVKAVGLASWFRKVLNSSALSCKAWGSETSMATQGMTLRRSLNRSSTTFVSIWKEKS